MKFRRITAVCLTGMMFLSITGCGSDSKETTNTTNKEEKIVIRVLENDTAKKEGYLQELVDAFNAAYKDKGITVVDANMDEYTDLAANGPYGYGPDILYQANDKLMTYAEDKHILPLTIEDFECYEYVPEEAWEALKVVIDGESYYCGVPVNIQEPMLFYRADKLPDNWKEEWDDNGNNHPDFFENWNDLYAYSKYLRETDDSPNHDSQYGFMASMNNLYLVSPFMLSYDSYIFGKNEDGTLNSADIGFAKGDAALGLSALKQMSALMYKGCIDDTITYNRYEKIADGTYFCSVSTPDTYSLFYEKLASHYNTVEGLEPEEALKKAEENLMMIEMPAFMPADGDLSKDSSTMTEADFVDTIVMGGVNGYGISSYTKHKEACIEFVNFATSYEMIKTRMEMLGIAPTRSDVAEESDGTADVIFNSLASGRIYLMPSIKAVDQIWVPSQTIMADVAKDAFRKEDGETEKYVSTEDFQKALETVSKNVYDAIYVLAE